MTNLSTRLAKVELLMLLLAGVRPRQEHAGGARGNEPAGPRDGRAQHEINELSKLMSEAAAQSKRLDLFEQRYQELRQGEGCWFSRRSETGEVMTMRYVNSAELQLLCAIAEQARRRSALSYQSSDLLLQIATRIAQGHHWHDQECVAACCRCCCRRGLPRPLRASSRSRTSSSS